MLITGWFDTVHFTWIDDIKKIFGEKGVLWYIKNLEDTFLDKNNRNKLSDWLSSQLAELIKKPDEWSDFEKMSKNIPQNLPDNILVETFLSMWYGINAKVLPKGWKIVSFVAYQEDTNNNLLKVFKLHTDDEYRWWRLTYDLVNWLLTRTNKNIQIAKWPIETEKVDSASEHLLQLYQENGYSVDMNTFTLINNR